MERYWPQHKAFFIATIALFPEALRDTIITLLFFKPYFAKDDIAVIELTLIEYQELGYLEFEKLKEGEFKITNVDTTKAFDDLETYLLKWQGDELELLAAKKPISSLQQHDLLIGALVQAYKLNPSKEQRLVLKDIYGQPASEYYGTPFWELVLSMHFAEDQVASITRIGYDRSMDGTYEGKAQPYVDFKITSQSQHRALELAANSSEPISDDDPQEIEYHELRIGRDGLVSYKGNTIPLTAQQREVVRVFLKRPGELRTKDAFFESSDIFTLKDTSPGDTRLSKLVSAVHGKLRIAIGGDCIFNTHGIGWALKIS